MSTYVHPQSTSSKKDPSLHFLLYAELNEGTVHAIDLQYSTASGHYTCRLFIKKIPQKVMNTNTDKNFMALNSKPPACNLRGITLCLNQH